MPAEPAFVLASRSEDKVREIRQILAPVFRGRLISLAEAGVAASEEEEGIEVFDTFLGNAHAKAAYFLARCGLPVLADDSGIRVDALAGRPGVHSRRFADRPDLQGRELDQANNERLLRELDGVPGERRGAHYACAAVLHLPSGRHAAALGTCSGHILTEPRGTGGFGYDPLFLDPASGRSFGELPPADKHRRSHRAAAFRALAANLPHLAAGS